MRRGGAPGRRVIHGAHQHAGLAPRRLFDGFEGKLTSCNWAAFAKCSPDTALRDITDLLARGVLRKSDAGGRSTNYELNDVLQPTTAAKSPSRRK